MGAVYPFELAGTWAYYRRALTEKTFLESLPAQQVELLWGLVREAPTPLSAQEWETVRANLLVILQGGGFALHTLQLWMTSAEDVTAMFAPQNNPAFARFPGLSVIQDLYGAFLDARTAADFLLRADSVRASSLGDKDRAIVNGYKETLRNVCSIRNKTSRVMSYGVSFNAPEALHTMDGDIGLDIIEKSIDAYNASFQPSVIAAGLKGADDAAGVFERVMRAYRAAGLDEGGDSMLALRSDDELISMMETGEYGSALELARRGKFAQYMQTKQASQSISVRVLCENLFSRTCANIPTLVARLYDLDNSLFRVDSHAPVFDTQSNTFIWQ